MSISLISCSLFDNSAHCLLRPYNRNEWDAW